VHGYRIVTKPTNDGAGKCLWAFAERAGKEYFIKKFLDPKRPRPQGMGSPAEKRQIFAQCREFERRHFSVIDRIDPADRDAGNLVTARDFFHEGTNYYKVTDRLRPATVQPQLLTPFQLRVLLKTLADSLHLLHRLGIVHGDLKPQNVLLHQPTDSDLYTAKLIDFDDAYVSGDPPGRDVIGGDPVYGAPEWVRYMHGDAKVSAGKLTTAVDTFAFGLMVHTYLTGAPPLHEGQFSSPAEAVNGGETLRFDARLSTELATVLRAATAAEPGDRPRVEEIRTVLGDESHLTLGAAPIRTGRPRTNTPAAEQRQSRVRVNLKGNKR
jgi:serine/threonine protein kinase